MILRRLILPAALGLALPFLFVSAVSAAVKHIVSPGETLSYIALLYETTVEEISGHNGIGDPDLIFPGQGLHIPGAGSGSAGSYVVRPGDTLSGIAYQHGVATEALQVANAIGDADLIYAGQALTIPGPAPAPAPPKLQFPQRPFDPAIEEMIETIAWQEGVDSGLVKAVATVESGWSQWAVSSAGAVGVMQLMPGTVYWLETAVFGFDLHEWASAWDNIRLGTRYLAILLDATGGDYYDAVSAYYQGLVPTEAGVYYSDTADYASMVLAVKAAYWPS